MLLVLYSRSVVHLTCRRAFSENMTSSTKPEVHNISQRRQSGRWAVRFLSYASGQTNGQTDILIAQGRST